MSIQTQCRVIKLTCKGKPLTGAYLPPAVELAELGRYLAQRYATSDMSCQKQNDYIIEDSELPIV